MSENRSAPLARLVPGSSAVNTLSTPPAIPIFFQRSPDFPGGPPRGIAGLQHQVVVGGVVVSKSTGNGTGTDGRIDVRVPPGGSATLQLLFGGKVVAEYEVSVDHSALSDLDAGEDPFDPGSTAQSLNEVTNGAVIKGTQERLRMLGYQIGHGGDGTGVSGVMTTEWERSVLDFQADQLLLCNAVINKETKDALRSQAKG
jgi:hypothetical protein